MNKRRYLYSLSVILLLITAVAGWFATNYLGNNARQEIVKESQASALTLSTYVSTTFTNIEGAVKSLAGSPWIAPALLSKEGQPIDQANSALDRYNSALNVSVSYLMNADGVTVASSNRNDPDSFLGKPYRFRPYFQEAVQGRPTRYFTLGITSGKRGFYASYPVFQNRPGQVLGVVVMKKDLDDMGTFFRKYSFSFLISPDGIIFLSSKPALLLKSFWTLDKTTQEKLIASRQFGNKPFKAVMKKEIVDGMEVTLEGKDYFVSRKMIDSDGWSIVLLTPTQRVWIYKLISILATIFVCFLIMVFSGIIYLTNRSQEALRQSEENKRLLLHAAGAGIFGVDATGHLIFVNPAALITLGFTEKEMLGQRAHALIHHSHKDGSSYPLEDCPTYASYTRAAESRVVEEVLWRKDGNSFPVEYSSMPIIKDDKVTGAVVTFRDITDRKQMEDALAESEEKYRSIFDNAPLGLLHFNKRGITTSCNDKFVEIIGAPREALMGLNMLDLPDKQIVEAIELALYGKLGYYDQEYHSITSNKITPVRALFTPITSEKGEVIGGVGIVEDITDRKRAEEALRESENRYRSLFENANESIFVAQDGKLVFLNPVTSQLIGYSSEELMGRYFIDFIHPDDRSLVAENYLKRLKGEDFQRRYMFRFLPKSGSTRWMEISGVRIEWAGRPATLSFGSDVTERKQTETSLRMNEALLSTALKLAHLGHWEYDVEGDLFTFNDHIYTLLHTNVEREGGYTMSSAQYTKHFVYPEDASIVASEIQKAIETSDPYFSYELEHRIVFDDGEIGYISVRYFIVKDDQGCTVKIYGVNQDITERKQAEEKILQMAYHDSLTGLPNRKLFSDRVDIALAQAKRNQKMLGIAMLDLDNFKGVNDTLGHDVGDLLLQATAERLSAALRKGDTVARFGGDEFLLILPDLKAIEDATRVAQKIMDSFHNCLLIGAHQLAVTMSIGIAIYPQGGMDEGMLLKNADIAMYQAKQAGRARYQIYKGSKLE